MIALSYHLYRRRRLKFSPGYNQNIKVLLIFQRALRIKEIREKAKDPFGPYEVPVRSAYQLKPVLVFRKSA